MALTNAGRDHLASAAVGAAVTAFNEANATIGVGNNSGSTAFNASQTNLQGSSKTRKAMDTNYPTVTTGNVLTFRSTFGTSDANYAWEEWGVFNNITDGVGTMLNRKVESLGTKTSAQTWQFTVTLTLNAA